MIDDEVSNMRTIMQKAMPVLIAAVMIISFTAFIEPVSAASKPGKTVLTSARAIDESSAVLKWKKAKGAKGYQIYRDGKLVERVSGAKTTSFVDTGLAPGTKYKYRVSAYKTKKAKQYFNKKTGKWQKKKPKKAYLGTTKKITTYISGKKSNQKGITTSGAYGAGTLSLENVRSDMIQQINAQRSKNGVPPLALYEPVNETAQEKAVDMFTSGVFSHYSSKLGYMTDQFRNHGITCYGWGENIAWGQSSVSMVMNGWMNSPGHRKNILNASHTHVGIGYHRGYWVQQFVIDPR